MSLGGTRWLLTGYISLPSLNEIKKIPKSDLLDLICPILETFRRTDWAGNTTKVCVGVLFAALLLLININSCHAEDEKQSLGRQSVAAYKKADYATAMSFAQKLLNLDSGDKEALYMRAICCKQMGMLTLAASDLESYLKLSPNDLNAKIALAQCWTDDGKVGRAVEYLEKIDKELPNNKELVFCLAYAYATYGDVNAWDMTAKRALKLAPDREDRYKLLIAAQLAHFDYSFAEQSANQYLKQFLHQPGPYRVLFEDFYLPQQRAQQADQLFARVETNKAFDASNYISMGEIFNKKTGNTYGNIKAQKNAKIWLSLAERSLKQGLALDQNNLHCALELASVLIAESKFREAAPLVQKALVVAPGDPVAVSLYRKVVPGKKDIAGQIKSIMRDIFSYKHPSVLQRANQ